MIHLSSVQVKEASRVWGDFEEKVAFEVDVNPTNILAAVAGSYAGTRTYQGIKDKREQEALSQKRIENDHYKNIQNVLQDLKIVFTPINVIYSVNGQSFEIIKVNEMTAEMKSQFLAKNAEYFKNILVQKMNMELQMAEQVFARRLLAPQLSEMHRQAAFTSLLLEKISEETFHSLEKRSLEKTASMSNIPLQVSFDSLRPFDQSEVFFNESEFHKVANPIDYFRSNVGEEYTQKDLGQQVKVGFLPDRVVFLLNGHMIEQLSVMNMNEEGYEAFRKNDKMFFLEFFQEEAAKIRSSVIEDVAKEELFNKAAEEEDEKDAFDFEEEDEDDEPEDEDEADEEENKDDDDKDEGPDDDEEKTAASLEEVFEDEEETWVDKLSVERDDIDLFADSDVHPLIYDLLLDNEIGPTWHALELEAVLKQMEVDFEVDVIGDRALDKIAMLHTVQNPENSLFRTPFTTEKFLRAMNGKSVIISDFEGGLEFEEILLGLEIAENLDPEETLYAEFGDRVAPYISEELFQDGVRYVSSQVYNENNPMELVFWKDVNGFLSRKWKEKDSHGQSAEESVETNRRTELIVETSEKILSRMADGIDVMRPYDSVREIIQSQRLLGGLSYDEETLIGIENAVTQLVGRHFIAMLFLALKRNEAVEMYKRISGEGDA